MNKRGDLISREALLKNAQRMTEYDEAGWGVPVRVVKVEHIENAPAVDAAPVLYAKWESIMDFGGGNCIGYCSNCHTEHMAQNGSALKLNYRHCRWCGARMDGE